MGYNKLRKAKFFARHPMCCFCGGATPATTRDHWPGRAFFINNHSPDDFVFPACLECNSTSRDSESLLRIILVANEHEPLEHARWQRSVENVRRNYPGFIDSMFMDTRAKRHAVKSLGLSRPPGTTVREMPIVKLDPEKWRPHINLFGQKTLLALHYQCFRKPLPTDGGLCFLVETNAPKSHDSIVKEFLEFADILTVPEHHHRQLDKQFSIRWSWMKNPDAAVWAVHFHGRLFYVGITSEKAELAQLDGAMALGPLAHES